MPRQCGRPRCDLIGEPGLGPLGREGCQACRCPLKRTTFGLARPDTMEHVEKVRPQFLSLRQLTIPNVPNLHQSACSAMVYGSESFPSIPDVARRNPEKAGYETG